MYMDEENKIENVNDTPDLKDEIKHVMDKLQTQSMLLGGQSMAIMIARMIDGEMNKPGKRTMADMKRIVKEVRRFCQVAIDHKVEAPKFGEEEDEE